VCLARHNGEVTARAARSVLQGGIPSDPNPRQFEHEDQQDNRGDDESEVGPPTEWLTHHWFERFRGVLEMNTYLWTSLEVPIVPVAPADYRVALVILYARAAVVHQDRWVAA